MILIIVLFLSWGMLVASNNGYPIIPTQTYPVYQQNGYANPFANQPSDNTPYLQRPMVQNQFPPLDFSPSNIRQILLNQILSSQPMQTIFNQISRSYGSNSFNVPNNEMVPNAVNNYFAVPMNEYVNNHPTEVNKEDKVADNKTKGKQRKNKKRKAKKSKRNHDSRKNQIGTKKRDKSNNLQSDDTKISKKSKKRSRKNKTEDSSHHNQTENIGNKTKKKSKNKKRRNHANNHVTEETNVDEHIPQRRHKNKSKQDIADKIVSEQPITPKVSELQEKTNFANFYEGHVEENRVPRNPVAEGNDLFKSIPELPQNIGNSFNFKGLPQFGNPAMANFFANYENMYQSMMAYNKVSNGQKETTRSKPKRRNNNITKTEVNNKNSTVAKVTVQIKPTKPTPKINVVTTEKTTHIIEKPPINIDPVPKFEDSKSMDKSEEEKGAKYGFENEELEDMKANINDPVLNYGYIDDYYPQFTDSTAYPTANNREVLVKNLDDTKYYYAVDKGNPELINRMRFESFELPKRVAKDYEVNKKYDNVEQEGGKSDAFKPKSVKEEVFQFRSPPHLETPDFQSRKIEKNEINSQPYYDYDQRFLGDKAEFVEAKLPYYAGTNDNSLEVKKDEIKDVETVFATSKVVNFGPGYNPEASTTESSIIQNLTDESHLKDGGISYVVATSYPEGVFW